MITSNLDAPGSARADASFARRDTMFARLARRTPIVALPLIAGLFALVWLLRGAAPGYPVGDHAILELYTVHAQRGWWLLGPYSRYGWNHPGPLLFYLIAPLYAASGGKTLAMTAVAWILNAGCASLIAWIVLRRLPVRARMPMLAALGIYAWRIQPLFMSIWNPHVLVWPMLALQMTAALAAAGRARALLPLVFLASFVAQTHVGIAPVAAIVCGAALATTIVSCRALAIAPWRWIAASAGLFLLLWLPPIADEIANRPGNLTQLYRFFITNPAPRYGWLPAAAVWADLMNGLFRPGLRMPYGQGLSVTANPASIAAAALQCIALAVAAIHYHRRGLDSGASGRMMAAACAVGLVSALAAWWSIAQVRGELFDHAVFWASAIGALNWGLVIAFACEWLPAAATRALDARLTARVALAAGIAGLLLIIVPDAIGFVRAAAAPDLSSTSRVKMLADQIEARIDRSNRQKAIFLIEQEGWDHAAGVILQLYKRRLPLAVHPAWLSMFGQRMGADGRERLTMVFIPRNSDPAPGDVVIGCTPRTCTVLR